MRSTAPVLLLVFAIACGPAPVDSGPEPYLAITEVLAGDPEGFAVAELPRDFVFPADHGRHPEFRTEWWYFTGHLAGEQDYGFQLTFFRSGLPEAAAAASDSAWRPDDLWMAHFAVGNYTAGRFHAEERFARGAAGLAGAADARFDVWLEDWSLTAVDPTRSDSALELRAATGEITLDLRLVPQRLPVLNGEAGLSRKGTAPGNASYYYSMTRWEAGGTLIGPDGADAVAGQAWLDREWSTSALEPGQIGWDWFSLSLSDGTDVMLYLMRRDDGTFDLTSSGTWVNADGSSEPLALEDYDVRVLDVWKSPSGSEYPAGWEIRIPDRALELRITPLLADQELRHTFRYWEGGVAVEGTHGETTVSGRGFVELTGYAGEPGG